MIASTSRASVATRPLAAQKPARVSAVVCRASASEMVHRRAIIGGFAAGLAILGAAAPVFAEPPGSKIQDKFMEGAKDLAESTRKSVESGKSQLKEVAGGAKGTAVAKTTEARDAAYEAKKALENN